MAFSFGLPLVQQDPNGGGVDLGAAMARLSGQGGGGYAPQPQQAPQPMPQAAPPQAQPQQQGSQASPYDIQVSPLEATMAFLAHGGTPAEAAQRVRAVKLQNMMDGYAIQQAQLRSQALQSAGPDEQRAVLYGDTPIGKAFADRLMTHTLNGGQTLVNGGAGGSPFTASTYGMDNGVGYALGPNVPGGLALSANRAPGETKVDAESGGLYNNNGPIAGQQFSRWRTFEPQQTAGDAFGGVKGGVLPGFPAPNGPPAGPLQLGVSAAAGSSQTPPSAPAATAQANAPRGIRNNNFGNLMALPNGHQWAGQVGTDPSGYAVFATPQDGINAATTNLQSYANKHGINTVAGVISRWAPAGSNNTPNYIHYVAGSMGVDPNQPLNMSDPNVQKGLTNGIFSFENGPQAMAALGQAGAGQRGQQASTPPAGTGQPGDSAPSFSAVHQGSGLRTLTPQEAQAAGFPPGAVVQQDAKGAYSVAQAPEYGPEAKSNLRNHVLSSDEYKQAQASMAAYKSMLGNASTMTGPSAYSMLDTFARAINPGAVARPTVIQTIEQNLGLPAQFVGSLESKFGKGNLPPQVRQQIIDAVIPFAQTHWDQARMLNDSNVEIAKAHHLPAGDVTAPLDDRPQRMIVTDDGAISEGQALAQARQAIAKGAPRAQVIGRLQSLHIRPAGI